MIQSLPFSALSLVMEVLLVGVDQISESAAIGDFFFFKIVFIHERPRLRQRHRQREKQTPWARCRIQSQDPGITTQPKADAQPLSHPDAPLTQIFLQTCYLVCPKEQFSIQCSCGQIINILHAASFSLFLVLFSVLQQSIGSWLGLEQVKSW